MGVAAVRVVVDDVLPRRGLLQRDLVASVGKLYEFNIKPTIPEGVPAGAIPILTFQSGQFLADDGKIPIIQLGIFPDGEGVTAQDTNLADIVLTDFLTHLNEVFGYRFTDENSPRSFFSGVVVEFASEFVEQVGALHTIQAVVNAALDQPVHHYQLKRLALGPDSSNDAGSPTSVEQLTPREFLIERRVVSGMERNRFFCGAPLAIDKHLEMLDRVERAVIG
jgi:hypothetical protein